MIGTRFLKSSFRRSTSFGTFNFVRSFFVFDSSSSDSASFSSSISVSVSIFSFWSDFARELRISRA